MRKHTLTLAATLAIVLALLACVSCARRDDVSIGIIGGADGPTTIFLAGPMPEAETEWEVAEGLTMRLAQDRYPVGVEQMTIILENRTDKAMLYGNGWTYERYVDGEWIPLENRDDAAFTMEGYVLRDHMKTTFTASTFALEEPLDVGLYRMTGCTLSVAESAYGLEHGEDFVDQDAYKLEFYVMPDAEAEPGDILAAGLDERGLRNKEDWELYQYDDMYGMHRYEGMTVWEAVLADDGQSIAALYRENTEENAVLEENALLMLDIFDRETGEVSGIFGKPLVMAQGVEADGEGGYNAKTSEGTYRIYRDGSEWKAELTTAAAE